MLRAVAAQRLRRAVSAGGEGGKGARPSGGGAAGSVAGSVASPPPRRCGAAPVGKRGREAELCYPPALQLWPGG